MNWRVYLTLLRPWHSAQMVGLLFMLFFGLRMVVINLLGNTEGNALAGWGFVMPVIFGFVLTDAVRAPMHHPFGMFLPDLRRHLARWHLGTMGTLTLLCTGMIWKYDSALPPLTVAGIVAVLNLILLPGIWQVIGRVSQLFVLLVLGILTIAMVFPEELRLSILAHPWSIGLGAWALAWFFFHGVFSCRSGKRNAQIPYLPFISSSISTRKKAEKSEGRTSSKVKHPSPWTTTPSDGSLRAWLDVPHYVLTGKNLIGSFMPLLRLCVLGGLSAILFAQNDSGEIDRVLYRFVWFYQKPDNLIFWIVILNSIRTTGFLRPSCVYPISRAQQAKVHYLNFVIGMIVKITAIGTTFVLVAWFVANRHDWPRPMLGVVNLFQMLAWLFAVGSLLQGISLRYKIRQNTNAQSILLVLAFICAVIFSVFVATHLTFIFSLTGVACLVVLIATSQYVYYAVVRRYFRKMDFIMLNPSRSGSAP